MYYLSNFQLSLNIMNLQMQIKLWITQKLAAMGRGSKARLAEHLGLTPTQISKMLNTKPNAEHRIIRADEYVKISEFFGGLPPEINLNEHDSKSEIIKIYDQVSPSLQKAILAMVRSLADEEKKQ